MVQQKRKLGTILLLKKEFEMLSQKVIRLTLVGYGLRFEEIQKRSTNDSNVIIRKHVITNLIERDNCRMNQDKETVKYLKSHLVVIS